MTTDHTTAEWAAFEVWFKTSGFWNDAITSKAWQAACAWQRAALSATCAEPVAIPEPDTTRYAQWVGDVIKYHSVDQLVEYGNACAKAALLSAPGVDAQAAASNDTKRLDFYEENLESDRARDGTVSVWLERGSGEELTGKTMREAIDAAMLYAAPAQPAAQGDSND